MKKNDFFKISLGIIIFGASCVVSAVDIPVKAIKVQKEINGNLIVFNVNRIDDEKQMVQFVDKNCKYIGESGEIKSGEWIIKVKEKNCQNLVETVDMVAYPKGRNVAPIPAGSEWILVNSPNLKE